jgi:PTS system mannose-specific IIA component
LLGAALAFFHTLPSRQLSGTTMIGLIVVTHGNLAREFVAALEHVVGPQQQIAAISIFPNDDMEERRNTILDAAKTADSGDGVIVLTDMFGGTPSNLAISVMDSGSIEVIAGVNLPMLVKLARIREEAKLTDALKAAQDAGRKYIHVASLVLNAH